MSDTFQEPSQTNKSETDSETQEESSSSKNISVLSLYNTVRCLQEISLTNEFRTSHIMRVFRAIQDWTGNFERLQILPSVNDLERQLEIPRAHILKCVWELGGLGDGNDKPLVAVFPCLYFPQKMVFQKVDCVMTYARPGQNEDSNLSKYIHAMNKINLDALLKWSQARTQPSLADQEKFIDQLVQSKTTFFTALQHKILELYHNQEEAFAKQMPIFYENFVKPNIRSLIEQKVLILYKTEFHNQKLQGLYWKRKEELSSLYEAFLNVYTNHTVAAGQSLVSREAADIRQALLDLNLSSFNDMQRHLVQEFYVFIEVWLQDMGAVSTVALDDTDSKEQDSSDDPVRKAILMLVKKSRPMEGRQLKLDSNQLELLANASEILHVEYPVLFQSRSFYLHRDQAADAVLAAKKDLEEQNKPFSVLVLSAMSIGHHLNRTQIQEFQELEKRAFFLKLPWFIRLFRTILNVQSMELKELIGAKKKEQKTREKKIEKIEESRARKAKKETIAKYAKKRLEKREKADQFRSLAEVSYEIDSKGEYENREKQKAIERNAEVLVKKVEDIIDEAWANNVYPNRTYLLENLSEFSNENDIVIFLKKYCSQKILSFTVNIERSEFEWPILISKHYVRRYGKAMLEKIKTEVEQQKTSFMPDQEKYDIGISIESFLERNIPSSTF